MQLMQQQQQHKSLETCKILVPNVFLCCFSLSLCFEYGAIVYFCLFCFVLLPTCAIQNQVHTEEDDNDEEEKEEEKMGVDVEEKSPEKGEAKTEVKDEGGNEDAPEILATKEASEIKPLEEEKKTDKSDAESSVKDSCNKVERVLSVSSNAIDNKENETKGDDK